MGHRGETMKGIKQGVIFLLGGLYASSWWAVFAVSESILSLIAGLLLVTTLFLIICIIDWIATN